jgi:hypothetical protein
MAARALERVAAVVAAALLIIGLVSAPERRAGAETLSIVTYGACTACTASANRVAIQAAIDAAASGDTIYIPPGTYYVDKVPTSSPWSLYITGKSLTIAGESRDTSIIALDPTQANQDVPFGNHLGVFYLKDIPGGATFRDLQLEGSKDNPDGPTEYEEAPEHHRGIFVWNVDGLLVEDTLIENFTGDALQLYIEANNTTVRRNIFRWNQRDGLTFSPAPNEQLTGVLVEYNEFYGNSNQQIDNEHGPAHNVVIRYNTLAFADNENSIGLAIAGAGTDGADPSTNWNVHNNTISGGIRFTWTSYSRIADNVITNPRAISGIELERVQTDNEVLRNYITCTQTAENNLAGIYMNGTAGGGAANILVEDNVITMSDAQAFGIRMDGVVTATVRGNTVVGAGQAAATYSGIRTRATVEARDVESVLIHYNDVRGFGQYGIAFAGTVNTQAKILYAELVGNKVSNDNDAGPQTTGINLNDSTGALRSVVLRNNVSGCGTDAAVNGNVAVVASSPLAMAVGCP